MLSRIHFLAVHIDCRDAKEAALGRGEGDFSTAVFFAVEARSGYPAFFEALENVGAEVLVVGISWAVGGVEVDFEVFAWGSGWVRCEFGVLCVSTNRFFISSKNCRHRVTSFCAVGYASRSRTCVLSSLY